MYDEPSFYTPHFFKKDLNDDEQLIYTIDGNKYWEMRDIKEGERWVDVPRIYEDNCESFF